MACVDLITKNNFLKFLKVSQADGNVSVASLQASGVPDFCGAVEVFGETIIIQTKWDDSSGGDGAFSITIVAASLNDDDFVWVLPDDSLVTGKTLTIAADAGQLDGTTKSISLTSEKFHKVDGNTTSWNAKKLTGSLDLSPLTGLIGTIALASQDSAFSAITFPITGAPDIIGISTNAGLTTLDLTGLTVVTGLTASNCGFTSVIGLSGNMATALFLNGNSLTTIDISGIGNSDRIGLNDNLLNTVTFGSGINAATTIELFSNLMTTAQVNKILVDIDSFASGSVARVLQAHGTNEGINEIAGGNDGVAAKASLEAKNYTVTVNSCAFTLTHSPVAASKKFNAFAQTGDGLNAIFIGDSGTKGYYSNDTVIYQYTLSTPYDVDTSSYASKSFDTNAGESVTTLRSIDFSSDGTKMIVLDRDLGDAFQYNLSTAWDVSTASLNSSHTTFGTEDATPQSLIFNNDGTIVYMVGETNDTVYQYDGMTTPWTFDGSFAFDSKSKDVSSEAGNPAGVDFNADESVMFILDNAAGDRTIYQYTLSTPGDVSTASFASISFDTGLDSVTEIRFKITDGFTFYIARFNALVAEIHQFYTCGG